MGEALRTIAFKVMTSCCGGTACVNSFGDEQLAKKFLSFKTWEVLMKPGDKLTGVTGRDQVVATMGIFGPITTYVLALKDIPGTHEFLLIDEGIFLVAVNIIMKEKGIFTNVASPSAKAKLRLLFDVAPLGFLIEKAGGYKNDGYQSVLDKVINNLDDQTRVAYGSKNEIIRFEETLYGS
ncbi:hypothetical protein V6N12_045318 [Hibiscus sabdariffa]|uniref:Fructose-1-6-bisphosphatase class 1 C-terminal domain-containing protein n=1 Tax=Hibiscus sabdariffa TaxID=183260 RepID=A0ABR2G2E2_9ROSI